MQQFESFAQMQRDAERRVMEMQRRAMAAVADDAPPLFIPQEEETADTEEMLPSPEPTQPTSLPLSDEDAERLLLLGILLLVKDHADPRLLFLLLYLLHG